MGSRIIHACDMHAPLAFMRLMEKDERGPGDSLVLDSAEGCGWCDTVSDAIMAAAAGQEAGGVTAAVREARRIMRRAYGRPWE